MFVPIPMFSIPLFHTGLACLTSVGAFTTCCYWLW